MYQQNVLIWLYNSVNTMQQIRGSNLATCVAVLILLSLILVWKDFCFQPVCILTLILNCQNKTGFDFVADS